MQSAFTKPLPTPHHKVSRSAKSRSAKILSVVDRVIRNFLERYYEEKLHLREVSVDSVLTFRTRDATFFLTAWRPADYKEPYQNDDAAKVKDRVWKPM